MEQKVTFCRICEAYCGLVATVEDGRLAKLRPDPDHPLSRGYACPKGIAMAEIQNDPDRVLHPLRNGERVSWEEAMEDVAHRLRLILDAYGPQSVAWYMGNPGAFSYAHTLWAKGFLDGIGSRHYYTAGSQDVNNRFAASALLYGSPLKIPIPDLSRTELLMIVGANPLVSHGSLLSVPRIRDHLRAITERGGRVVVVDPRRSETARAFEHLPIRPDSDAWLLLGLLHVMFDEGLEDAAALRGQAKGADRLRAWALEFPPETSEERTGIPAKAVRRLARDLAAARSAVYGRTGSCLGRHGTLVAFLLDALNVVAGNLDRPGGAVFGRPAIPLEDVARRFGLDTYDTHRSRVGHLPEVIGSLPASLIAEEIETPGEGQIRALFVSAGNPVLSVPDGGRLERALQGLDLLVSLDFYVNETNRHADYVLPATTFLERDDVALASLGFYVTPFVQSTPAVLAPAGEARPEWAVIDDLSGRIGIQPYSVAPLRWLGRAGLRIKPRTLLDGLLRSGPEGVGRGGLSLAKLERDHPHGKVLADHVGTGVHQGRVRLDPRPIGEEIERLHEQPPPDPAYPLRLIGLRELRSHNSWMHNSPKLMSGGRVHALRMHPDDARRAGIEERARLVSASGALEDLPVKITEEMTPGTVALPHGWGHRGGWQTANASGGANVNLLASSRPEDLERLAGMAHLNGIPVRAEPFRPSAAPRSGGAARRSSPLPTAP